VPKTAEKVIPPKKALKVKQNWQKMVKPKQCSFQNFEKLYKVGPMGKGAAVLKNLSRHIQKPKYQHPKGGAFVRQEGV
jgi:hypothetical protein